jgi:hypothetical protein
MVRCYEGKLLEPPSHALSHLALLPHSMLPDPEITHVENTVDPVRDIDILDAELILSDQALLESMLAKKSTGLAMRAVIDKTMKGGQKSFVWLLTLWFVSF